MHPGDHGLIGAIEGFGFSELKLGGFVVDDIGVEIDGQGLGDTMGMGG